MPTGPGSRGPPGNPPSSPGQPGSPGGKRPAIGLQIKLPCATIDEVKARYGEPLRKGQFFIRTKTPRAKETLVRLGVRFSNGTPCFRAAAVVERVQDAPDAGMGLQLLAVDDAARRLIAALGGKQLPQLKTEAPKAAAPAPGKTPAIPAMPGISAPPPA